MSEPPLGLMPRDIWELQRLRDVKKAIQRYLEDGRKIPMEWVKEFNELLNKPVHVES